MNRTILQFSKTYAFEDVLKDVEAFMRGVCLSALLTHDVSKKPMKWTSRAKKIFLDYEDAAKDQPVLKYSLRQEAKVLAREFTAYESIKHREYKRGIDEGSSVCAPKEYRVPKAIVPSSMFTNTRNTLTIDSLGFTHTLDTYRPISPTTIIVRPITDLVFLQIDLEVVYERYPCTLKVVDDGVIFDGERFDADGLCIVTLVNKIMLSASTLTIVSNPEGMDIAPILDMLNVAICSGYIDIN